MAWLGQLMHCVVRVTAYFWAGGTQASMVIGSDTTESPGKFPKEKFRRYVWSLFPTKTNPAHSHSPQWQRK